MFFDLDDTLLSTSSSGQRRLRLAYEALRAEHPELTWKAFRGAVTQIDPAHGFWRGIRAGIADLGLSDSPATQAAIGLWFFDGCPELLRTYPGAKRAIQSLARIYKLGVITNGADSIQRRKFDGLGIARHFDIFIASAGVGVQKPDRAIFELALAQAAVPPHEAAFVGDHLEWDVGGAKAAGMHAIWFNPKELPVPPDAVAPAAIIRRFGELPALLAKLA